MASLIAAFLLPSAMFAVVLSMGLTLTPQDFRRVADDRKLVLIGLFLQLAWIPAIGVAIAYACQLPPVLGAGLVVLAACPGGMLSNLLVHLARANTALSVSLTALATVCTLVTIPLWVRLLAALSGSRADRIDLPILQTAVELGMLVLVPLALGMLVRQRHPPVAALEPRLSRWSLRGIVVAMVLDFQDRDLPTAEFSESLVPALALAVVASVSGWIAPRSAGADARDAATIAVELVAKNGLLAMVVARQSLGFEAMLPCIAFAMFQAPLAILILVAWRVWALRSA